MALTTIDGLINEVVSFSDALTTLQAQTVVTLGEARIYREMKTRQMEASTTITMTSGVVSASSSMIELRNAYLDSNPQQTLQRKSPDWIRSRYPDSSASAKPQFIARDGNNFIFGPRPDSTYAVVLNTYERPATAVGGTLTGLLASAPGLLLFAALIESEPFLGRDARMQVWEQRYQTLRDAILLEDKREKFSGPPLAVTPS